MIPPLPQCQCGIGCSRTSVVSANAGIDWRPVATGRSVSSPEMTMVALVGRGCIRAALKMRSNPNIDPSGQVRYGRTRGAGGRVGWADAWGGRVGWAGALHGRTEWSRRVAPGRTERADVRNAFDVRTIARDQTIRRDLRSRFRISSSRLTLGAARMHPRPTSATIVISCNVTVRRVTMVGRWVYVFVGTTTFDVRI